MPEFAITKAIDHSSKDMFALVADINSYPEFIPFCDSVKVLEVIKDDNKQKIVIAEMVIGYKLLSEKFISKVIFNKDTLDIDVESIDNTFSKMRNIWRFHNNENQQCQVYFYIDYHFNNYLFNFITNSLFDKICQKFIKTFEDRANNIYKK